MAMAAMTNSLNRVFSSNLKTVRMARKVGLRILQKFPKGKEKIIRYAMGKNPWSQ